MKKMMKINVKFAILTTLKYFVQNVKKDTVMFVKKNYVRNHVLFVDKNHQDLELLKKYKLIIREHYK